MHNISTQILHPRNRNVVPRISGSLVQKADRLPIQRHKLAFKAHVADTGNIIFAKAPIILEEESYRGGRIPQSPIDVHLKYSVISLCHGSLSLRNLYGLCW